MHHLACRVARMNKAQPIDCDIKAQTECEELIWIKSIVIVVIYTNKKCRTVVVLDHYNLNIGLSSFNLSCTCVLSHLIFCLVSYRAHNLNKG